MAAEGDRSSARSPEHRVTTPEPLVASALESVGALVVVLDEDGRIEHVNQATAALCGIDPAVVRGQCLWEAIVAPDDAERVRQIFLSAGTGESVVCDCRLRGDSSRQRSAHWSCARSRSGPDAAVQIVAVGIDTSDLSSARAAALENAARLQTILDTAVDGIITIDERGTIESANHAVKSMFGYDTAALIGRNVKVLMPKSYADEHDGYLRHYLQTGERRIIGTGREVEGRRADGSTFPIDLAVSEVDSRDRRLFTGIIRDLTERKRHEEQARLRVNEAAHAGRLLELGEMTSGIAHEVNQPLTAIVSFAQASLRMLKAGRAEPEVMESTLAQIAEQGERAGAIIHRMRRLARKGDQNPEPVDVNAAVVSVLALLEHDLRRAKVSVQWELASPSPSVLGDRVQIEQVVLNLVRNAIDAMRVPTGREPRLTVRTLCDGDATQLEIEDSGSGLPGGDCERVFETFFTTKPQGVGVGLAICRSIVETHRGRLWAEDTGAGSVFRCRIPALVQ